MADVMFFSEDRRSMRRGRRCAPRTETCRPCMVWCAETPGDKHKGVVLDISPYGMRIRMLHAVPEGTAIEVQLMRDDEFTAPLAQPLGATVANARKVEHFFDHGVQIVRDAAAPPEVRPARKIPKPSPETRVTRMYSFDVTVGTRLRGRSGR